MHYCIGLYSVVSGGLQVIYYVFTVTQVEDFLGVSWFQWGGLYFFKTMKVETLVRNFSGFVYNYSIILLLIIKNTFHPLYYLCLVSFAMYYFVLFQINMVVVSSNWRNLYLLQLYIITMHSGVNIFIYSFSCLWIFFWRLSKICWNAIHQFTINGFLWFVWKQLYSYDHGGWFKSMLMWI